MPICILGMHRSGTSLLAKALGSAGVNLISPHSVGAEG